MSYSTVWFLDLNEEDHWEYEDPEVVWAISRLDRIISYTRSCVVEQSTAPLSRDSQAETITFGRREPESRDEALVKGRAKHPGPPANNVCSNLAEVKSSTISNSIQKSEDIESSRLEGLQSAGGDAESSEQSRLWSTTEIELIPIHDDTVVRASASVIAGQPKVQGQEVESNSRPRKWQWACFAPGISREHELRRRTNFSRYWKSRIGGSARYIIGKGYETDGEETHVPKYTLVPRGQSLDRFVTLGKFLVDDDELSQNLSVDI